MATLALSTLSVITSIFIFRLNDTSSSPLPNCVRVIAFRCLARVLCVRVSQTRNTTSTLYVVPADCPNGSTSSTTCNVKLTDAVNSRQGATKVDCFCQLKPQVDNILHELRKVTVAIYIMSVRPSFRLSESYNFTFVRNGGATENTGVENAKVSPMDN